MVNGRLTSVSFPGKETLSRFGSDLAESGNLLAATSFFRAYDTPFPSRDANATLLLFLLPKTKMHRWVFASKYVRSKRTDVETPAMVPSLRRSEIYITADRSDWRT